MAAGTSARNRATMEKSSLLLKLKACAGQRVTLFKRLDRQEDTMLDAHTRQPIMVVTQRYLGVLRFCRWSQPGHHQKSALFISEIRVERSHSMFCTSCHKRGGNTSIQEKTMKFSTLHRHLICSFVYWYNRQVLLLLLMIRTYV